MKPLQLASFAWMWLVCAQALSGAPPGHCGDVVAALTPQYPRLWKVSGWLVAKGSRNFDQGKFSQARISYRALLAKGDPPATALPVTPEEKLALFIALGQQSENSQRDVPWESVLGTLKGRKTLGKVLRKLDFHRGLTSEGISEAMSGLFLAGHSDPKSVFRLVRGGYANAIKGVVREAYEEAFATQGLVPVFESFGLTRDASFREKVSRFLFKESKAREATLTGLLTLPFFTGDFAIPGYLPNVKISPGMKLSPELFKRVEAEGFDSIYPELKQLYGARPHFDMVWSTVRKAYGAAIFAVFVTFLIEDTEDGIEKIEQENAEFIGEAEKISQRVEAPETVGNKMMDAWREIFQAEKGRAPTEAEIQEAKVIFGG